MFKQIALTALLAPSLVWAFGGRNPSSGSQFKPSGYTPGLLGASSFGSTSCAGKPVPASVQTALQEIMSFKNSCRHLAGFDGSGKKIAINDYSGGSMPPRMYIFDASGKNCLKSVAIAYGGGGRGVSPPAPCSGDGQKLTPPGIHITATHNGKRYAGANAIGMVGLSGQGSVGRGVIMHPKNSAGAPSTWGCTGISPSEFASVRQMLGEGSLVHNYFGYTNAPGYCSDKSGLQRPPNGSACRPDPGGASPQALIRAQAGSGGFGYGSESSSGPRSRRPRPGPAAR